MAGFLLLILFTSVSITELVELSTTMLNDVMIAGFLVLFSFLKWHFNINNYLAFYRFILQKFLWSPVWCSVMT